MEMELEKEERNVPVLKWKNVTECAKLFQMRPEDLTNLLAEEVWIEWDSFEGEFWFDWQNSIHIQWEVEELLEDAYSRERKWRDLRPAAPFPTTQNGGEISNSARVEGV